MSDFITYKIHALEEIGLDDILAYVKPMTDDYLWHYNPFHLVQVDVKYFQGKTVFEDAISDEWKIVDILYSISENFPVIIEVCDADGEFLLIEAAEELPKWLDPSTSLGRIYIFKKELHIIPREISNPTLDVSINAILSQVETRASPKIQNILYAKMKMHASCKTQKAQITVPHIIGHLLYYDPQLISYCINAFYNRDPSSIKVCQIMETFKPTPENMVNMTAKMTRMMYAQLDSARFPVMKPFAMPNKDSQEFKSYDLGMKITCGFEMLYHDPHWNQQLKSLDSVNDFNFDIDAGWRLYQKRLEKIGYYRQEIKDSALYQLLERQAKEQYLADKRDENEYMNTKNPLQAIKEILKIPLVKSNLLPSEPSDTDEWLNIDHETEEDMKLKFSSEGLDDSDSSLDEEEEEEIKNMSKWVDGFNDFMNVKSGVSGALFPGEVDQDTEDKLNFDSKKFFKVIMDSMGIQKKDLKEFKGRVDNLDSDSSDDDSLELNLSEEKSNTEYDSYMASMDEELRNTKIGSALPSGPECEQVKMDTNLVKNLIDSFSAQEGLPGPVSNIMLSLNTPLPKKQ